MRLILVASLCIFAAISCKTGGDKGSKVLNKAATVETTVVADQNFDVLDASFLLPFPTPDFEIKASDGGSNGALLAKRFFDSLPPEFVAKGHPNIADLYDKLRITAFRFDPCFPRVPDDLDVNKCTIAPIRLVGQIITGDTATEASMHILFKLADKSVRKALIQDLKDLKAMSAVSTNGRSLGVHPGFSGILSKDPKAVAFAAKFREILFKYAGEHTYFATSIMFAQNKKNVDGSRSWFWAQMRRNPATERLDVVPTSGVDPNSQGDLRFSELRADEAEAQIIPPPIAALPQLSPILVADAHDTAGVVAAFTLENPGKVMIPQGDCASCHLATPRRLAFEEVHGVSTAGDAVRYKGAQGLTTSMSEELKVNMKSSLNAVINFGYLKKDAVVSQRTINEAADSARIINNAMWDSNW
jgi:hypothetical protein